MSICTESSTAAQDRRVRLKQQGQQLHRQVVDGTNLSDWEARILLSAIEEVYFREAKDRPLRDGELRFTCTSASAPAGKSLKDCPLTTVVLPLQRRDEDREVLRREGGGGLRRQRIMRLTEHAREQGGYLTQEDLGELLCCDVRTIRRDIQALRELGIIVATRGQQKDIGPGVSHRGVAIRFWLEGHDPVEVARRIKHSQKAVDRYLQAFARCVYCHRKGFTRLEVALTVGISTAAAHSYLDLYEQVHRQPGTTHRWEELDLIGQSHWNASDAKKGISTSTDSSNSGRTAR